VETKDYKSYIFILVLSALFLFVGNFIATRGLEDSGQDDFASSFMQARVVEIIETREIVTQISPDFSLTDVSVEFVARITTRGDNRGDIVTATHLQRGQALVQERQVEVGDRVILFYDTFGDVYFLATHVRIHYVAILSGVFFLLILVFGRRQGVSSIIALMSIILAVLFVFIPAVLNGRNIYIATFVICLYAILTTLLVVVGPTKKALASVLGCLGGVLFASIIMTIMNAVMGLTGYLDTESTHLLLLDNPVNLRAIIFAGVIIGAVGSIIDIAITISSSIWEVKSCGRNHSFKSLMSAGLNVGRDLMGAQINTLIMAYVGSSLTFILLTVAHSTSLMILFNAEIVLVELLRAIVGSMGMLLVIPLTAMFSGWIFNMPSNDIDDIMCAYESEDEGKPES